MTSITRRLAGSLLLGFVALAAHAAGPAVQEVALGRQPVHEDIHVFQHSLARLSGGGYAVVWDEIAPQRRAKRLQYVRPDGSLVLPDGGLVVVSSERLLVGAVVIPHPSSGAFVAFREADPQRRFYRVFVQWIDAAGQRRWPADGVIASEPPGQLVHASEPRLVADDHGGVFVCSMVELGRDDEPINCQHLDANGKRLWTDAGLETGGKPGRRTVLRVVRDGAGGILVFSRNQGLRREDDQADFTLLEGQRLAPDGTRLWGEEAKVLRINKWREGIGASSGALDAVADGHGGAVLAFEDWSGDAPGTLLLPWDVYALRVTGGGQPVWGEGVAVATGPLYQKPDALVAAPDGGAFIAVTEHLRSNRSRISLFRILADGRHAWGEPGVALSDPQAKANDYLPYGSFDDGFLRMAWTHQRKPSTFTMDIHLAVFDTAGRRLSPQAGIPLNAAPHAQVLRGFVFDPDRRQGFALFSDRHNGDSDNMDVYGALYREK